jgi:hypothetical protein
MQNDEFADEATELFESFYDDDSGAWSLRRVSTIPAPPNDE